MSKATRQGCTLLCIIGGCLIEITQRKLFAEQEPHDLCVSTYSEVKSVLADWPQFGSIRKNVEWATDKVERWRMELEDMDPALLIVLCAVMEQCLEDLQSKTKDRFKIGLLKRVDAPIRKIHEFAGQNGENFEAYEKAEKRMERLYELIEWQW